MSNISQRNITVMAKLTATSVLKSASGMEMPMFGLGTWQSLDADMEKALHTALEVGYRLIDTAFLYNNEKVIGRVLSEWLRSGKISRQDIFITTKLPLQGCNPKLVREYLLKQLKALQLEYVDLYLIHHPVGIMPGEEVKHEGSTVDNTGLKLDMTTDHVAVWKLFTLGEFTAYLFMCNPKLVREYLLKQLKALQLEYVDLYLIHHPVGIMPGEEVKHEGSTVDNTGLKLDMTTDHVAVWKEMEKQVDDGLTKAIGISNFNTKQIERILNVARIPPANLQIELYLYNQGKAEQDLCRQKGITMTSYCTLGSREVPTGLLSGSNLNPLQDQVVCRIAKSHNKSTGQVLLRHVLQLGIAIIPKSSNPNRIRENFQVFDFELSATEMEELNNLDKGEEGRRFHVDAFKPHPEYPYPQ